MKISLSDILYQLVLRGIVLATVIHEYGHLLALRFLRLNGVIRSTALNMVYPQLPGRPLTLYEQRVFFAGGGLFQVVVFALLSLRDQDPEDRTVNIMMMIQGMFYGLFETFAPRNLWDAGAFIGMIGATAFLVFVLLKRKTEPIP